jgi:hypothetical protein
MAKKVLGDELMATCEPVESGICEDRVWEEANPFADFSI